MKRKTCYDKSRAKRSWADTNLWGDRPLVPPPKSPLMNTVRENKDKKMMKISFKKKVMTLCPKSTQFVCVFKFVLFIVS